MRRYFVGRRKNITLFFRYVSQQADRVASGVHRLQFDGEAHTLPQHHPLHSGHRHVSAVAPVPRPQVSSVVVQNFERKNELKPPSRLCSGRLLLAHCIVPLLALALLRAVFLFYSNAGRRSFRRRRRAFILFLNFTLSSQFFLFLYYIFRKDQELDSRNLCNNTYDK